MTQDELADKTEQIAQNTMGPNKQIVHAIANQIRSNGRVEESLDNFSKSTNHTEIIMIMLTAAQIILAVTSILVAVFVRS